jgi:hypothetical protein
MENLFSGALASGEVRRLMFSLLDKLAGRTRSYRSMATYFLSKHSVVLSAATRQRAVFIANSLTAG